MKQTTSDLLLDLCIATMRDEIMPSLPRQQRYAAAMIGRALAVVRRELANDGEAPVWALLDELYEPGEGSLSQLARDIRSGEVSEMKNPGLGQRLLKLVEAELSIVNPDFTKSTR